MGRKIDYSQNDGNKFTKMIGTNQQIQSLAIDSSNNVVCYNIVSNKSYQNLILPALEKINQQFSWNQIKTLFCIPIMPMNFIVKILQIEPLINK